MSKILTDIINAHGGMKYWNSLDSVEIEMSAGGVLFITKGVKPLNHARLTIFTTHPEVVIHDYPVTGQTTRLLGDNLVEIVDAVGKVLQVRNRPRDVFRKVSRFFHWDTLDFAYFCGYAMWGYITAPFLFLHEGVDVKETNCAEGYNKFTVTFPQTLPVHCGNQEFSFDKEHHLNRLDYTAEVVGSWAKAAHFCDSYQLFDGLSLPTVRRVYPKLLFNKPMKFITLVAIDIHNVIPNVAVTD